MLCLYCITKFAIEADFYIQLKALMAGKLDTFASLSGTYADRLYRRGMSLVCDPFEAEEVVQLKQAGIGLSGS
jgi:hypothetical protein